MCHQLLLFVRGNVISGVTFPLCFLSLSQSCTQIGISASIEECSASAFKKNSRRSGLLMVSKHLSLCACCIFLVKLTKAHSSGANHSRGELMSVSHGPSAMKSCLYKHTSNNVRARPPTRQKIDDVQCNPHSTAHRDVSLFRLDFSRGVGNIFFFPKGAKLTR